MLMLDRGGREFEWFSFSSIFQVCTKIWNLFNLKCFSIMIYFRDSHRQIFCLFISNKNHRINLENIVNVWVISHTFLFKRKKLLTGSILRRGKWLFLFANQRENGKTCLGQSCNSIKVRPFSKGSTRKKVEQKFFFFSIRLSPTYALGLYFFFALLSLKKCRPIFFWANTWEFIHENIFS